MKVGILTFHWPRNAGALLQAAALRDAVVRLGHTCDVLDYRPAHAKMRTGFRGLGFQTHFGAAVRQIPGAWRFVRFARRHLSLSRRATSATGLADLLREYDAAVVGSDQVWNAVILGDEAEAYTLPAPASLRRIAYAASIGRPDQPADWGARLGDPLRNFARISVRDEVSRAFLQTHAPGIPVAVVCDPILLELAHAEPPIAPAGDAVVFYGLTENSEHEIAVLSRQIGQRLGRRVVGLAQKNHLHTGGRIVRSFGPEQWCQHVARSAFFVTDSFHGALFALKQRKPFIVVTAAEGFGRWRLLDLAARYGVRERVVFSAEAALRDDLWAQAIDFDAIHATLRVDAQRSYAFLAESLAATA